jgi:hypothetical protein
VSKDPAFLLYSKDWLEGTAGLSPGEKGIYIDLLCHQHQKKSLPAEPHKLAKLCGISVEEFWQHWPGIKSKFVLIEVVYKEVEEVEGFVINPELSPPPQAPEQPNLPFGQPNGQPYGQPLMIPFQPNNNQPRYQMVDHVVYRLVNQKLDQVVNQRLTVGHTKMITSRFAVLMRTTKNLVPDQKAYIKEKFNVDDFQGLTKNELTKRLTEWFTKRLTEWSTTRFTTVVTKTYANANADNKDVFQDEEKEVLGDSRGKGEKEEGKPKGSIKNFGAVPDEWNRFPMPEDLNGLPAPYVEKTIELIFRVQKIKMTETDITSLWDVFKLQNMTGKNVYADSGKVYSHFLNWIEKKKITSEEKKLTIAEKRKKALE